MCACRARTAIREHEVRFVVVIFRPQPHVIETCCADTEAVGVRVFLPVGAFDHDRDRVGNHKIGLVGSSNRPVPRSTGSPPTLPSRFGTPVRRRWIFVDHRSGELPDPHARVRDHLLAVRDNRAVPVDVPAAAGRIVVPERHALPGR